jgi:DNA-binding MarR family transcriptional regulator
MRGTLSGVADSEVVAGQQILPLIDHLARLGRRAADSTASSCLRPRHLIAIKVLGDHGPMTQHALGEALSLDPSNVVGVLNELEERGLIERRRDPADRRRHIVSLSSAGEGELALSESQLGHVEANLLKALSPAERATLYDLLVRAVGGVMQGPCVAAANPCVKECS